MKFAACLLALNSLFLVFLVSSSLAGGQASVNRTKIAGESLVLAGREPGRLMFTHVVPGTITVRSTYRPDGDSTVIYEQGRDYVVDYARGTVARSPASRIPDFAKNVLYGQKDFDHGKFPGYGNHEYFVWVDYETKAGSALATRTDQSAKLAQTRAKLNAGGPFEIIIFGDSISAGGEASSPDLQFQNLYADVLRKRFPKADISVRNGATGGDSTVQGLQRIEEKVICHNPDLVLVGFGMNDHNIPGHGVAPDDFEANLGKIISLIRSRTGAELILFSTFPPHPDWAFGSHRMDVYAEITKRVAEEQDCAYADVYCVWMKVLARKDASSLLANNINHPNDFGHWLYLHAFEAVGL